MFSAFIENLKNLKILGWKRSVELKGERKKILLLVLSLFSKFTEASFFFKFMLCSVQLAQYRKCQIDLLQNVKKPAKGCSFLKSYRVAACSFTKNRTLSQVFFHDLS